MKLLITGAAGQLGHAFAAELSAQTTFTFCAFSRADLDITSAEHVNAVIVREQPDVVINTAAYTHRSIWQKRSRIAPIWLMKPAPPTSPKPAVATTSR